MLVKFFVILSFLALVRGENSEGGNKREAEVIELIKGEGVWTKWFAKGIGYFEITTNTNKTHRCIKHDRCNEVLKRVWTGDPDDTSQFFFQSIHAGNWNIIGENEDGTVIFENQLTVVDRKEIRPAQYTFNTFKGYLIALEFGEAIDKKSIELSVIDPSGQKYAVPSEAASKQGIKPIGNHGVSELVDDESNGTWILEASSANYIKYRTEAQILVRDRISTSNILNKVYIQRGTRAVINISPEPGINVCELIDSRNVSLHLSGKKCYHEIDHVTNLHAGQWRAIYSLDGRLEPLEYNFIVRVYDDNLLDASVEIDETRGTILECRHRINPNSPGFFCRFFRPDNVIFYSVQGAGTDSYSSYMRTEDDKEEHTCGLIIRTVSTKDYGLWRCEIGSTEEPNLQSGAFIEYKNPAEKNKTRVTPRAEDVIVKRGDSFKISCTADVSLKYCYFLAPNKEFMTDTNNPKSVTESTLLYNGIGLTAGRCGAIIPNARDIHAGEWKCFMETRDGLEVQVKFKLTLTESVLIIRRQQIPTKANNTKTRLSLQFLPTVTDKEIQFCRWIKPNAISLNEAMENRYTVSKNGSQCQLMISDPKAEDLGRWTCIASLTDGTVIEVAEYDDEPSIRKDQIQNITKHKMVSMAPPSENQTHNIMEHKVVVILMICAIVSVGIATAVIYLAKNYKFKNQK